MISRRERSPAVGNTIAALAGALAVALPVFGATYGDYHPLGVNSPEAKGCEQGMGDWAFYRQQVDGIIMCRPFEAVFPSISQRDTTPPLRARDLPQAYAEHYTPQELHNLSVTERKVVFGSRVGGGVLGLLGLGLLRAQRQPRRRRATRFNYYY